MLTLFKTFRLSPPRNLWTFERKEQNRSTARRPLTVTLCNSRGKISIASQVIKKRATLCVVGPSGRLGDRIPAYIISPNCIIDISVSLSFRLDVDTVIQSSASDCVSRGSRPRHCLLPIRPRGALECFQLLVSERRSHTHSRHDSYDRSPNSTERERISYRYFELERKSSAGRDSLGGSVERLVDNECDSVRTREGCQSGAKRSASPLMGSTKLRKVKRWSGPAGIYYRPDLTTTLIRSVSDMSIRGKRRDAF